MWGAFLASSKERKIQERTKKQHNCFSRNLEITTCSLELFVLGALLWNSQCELREPLKSQMWVVQELKSCIYLKARKCTAFCSTRLMTRTVKEIKKNQNNNNLATLCFHSSSASTTLPSLFLPSHNIEWAPGVVLGAADKMVSGAGLFFCLHRAPVSWGKQTGKQEITVWGSVLSERARGTPRPPVLRKASQRMAKAGGGQEAPGFFTPLLPSSFPLSSLISS